MIGAPKIIGSTSTGSIASCIGLNILRLKTGYHRDQRSSILDVVMVHFYEISDSGVQACRSKNLSAVCDRIDVLHPELEYKSFDYAICNVTIQMVEFPEILISEMARVAAHQVISFPNFAYYKNRLDMLIQGRMPQPMMFGYEWFSTGHIHQLSIRDFRDFIKKNTNLKMRDETHIGSNTFGINFLRESFPNLFSSISIFLLSEDL